MKLQQLKYVIAVADTQSMNEAAKQLFVAQPSLSGAIRALENELGFEIFIRSNRGVETTREGAKFISYVRQVVEQIDTLERRFMGADSKTCILSISEQHYAFAVKAMIDYINEKDFDSYDISMRECRTSEVIEDVRNFRSEMGIVAINKFNRKVMTRMFKDNHMTFEPLFSSKPHVFIGRKHKLASKELLTLEDLSDYPYLCYEQKNTDSLYFSEEILSTIDHRKTVFVSDRSTIFNMLNGINGYTIGTNMTCRELNGDEVISIPLDVDEEITVGFIKLTNHSLSLHAEEYVRKLKAEVSFERKNL